MSRRVLSVLCISLFVIGAAPTVVAAQADVLLRLRSGSPAGDRFRVDSAGGILAVSQIGIGIIPASGSGDRLMWHPGKGAFRAGSAGGSGTTAWDEGNIGYYSWAGGSLSRASAVASFAFGDQVTVTGAYAIGLGVSHTVSGTAGFAAGNNNVCSGFACVAAGLFNRAAGNAAVALGERVHASADWSVALGRRAHAKHPGTFAWGDASTTDSLLSTTDNQFSIRAAGGVRMFTNSVLTAGVTLNAGGSTWNAVSDRARKENFGAVHGEDILRRLRAVPVTSWNYTAEGADVRHIGPMAQDWHAAFALNTDSLTINQGDFDGINLAAIQALERRTAGLRDALADRDRQARDLRGAVEARDRRIDAMERELAALRALVAALLERDAAGR
jgi:trimeric autotransporter adhesin